MIKLWHCYNARSVRVLWALEEMQLPYELVTLPFPPRWKQKDFLEINPLGTVPFVRDENIEMTESVAICQYLADIYQQNSFRIQAENPHYADYLNWLNQSDATLTFPQALIIRYGFLEPLERRSNQVADDYRQWFLARLRRLDTHLLEHDYLCDERFTIADICIGYALHLGDVLGMSKHYQQQTIAYLERLRTRPAFITTQSIGKELNAFADYHQ